MLTGGKQVGGDGSDAVSSTIREQLVVLAKFRDGDLNCLFATSVAEEGLDIPECNLIIRFDLYKTMIQYIQSRGRARHENSIYIHMIEVGNRLHARVVAESQSKEEALRLFCQGLPDDRKLLGNDVDLASCLEKDRRQKRLLVPGTNALLTYQSSLLVLANFVASLPRPSAQAPPPADYTLVPGPNGGFVGEVTMPQASPIRTAVGHEHARKQVAKCAAAFEMCVLLLKAGYLTAHLEPVFAKQLPALRNARLAIRSKDKSEYPMRTKPRLWAQLGPPAPAELFATVLTLACPAAMHYASRPLVLLTRRPLPRLQPFYLFFAEGRASEAQCIPLRASLRPDPAALDALTAFTLRLFHDVFSKRYEGSASDLPYFLAPAAHGHSYRFEDNQEEKGEDDEAGRADHVASPARLGLPAPRGTDRPPRLRRPRARRLLHRQVRGRPAQRVAQVLPAARAPGHDGPGPRARRRAAARVARLEEGHRHPRYPPLQRHALVVVTHGRPRRLPRRPARRRGLPRLAPPQPARRPLRRRRRFRRARHVLLGLATPEDLARKCIRGLNPKTTGRHS